MMSASYPFLSPAWFDAVRAVIGSARLSEESHCRLAFDAEGERWYLLVEAGVPTVFDRGEIPAPDAELRWTLDDAWRIAAQELRGSPALEATTVVARAEGREYTGRPAPSDLTSTPEMELLPHLPGASVRVQYSFRKGPFGTVDHGFVFEDGRIVDECLGQLAEPDVRVDVTYRAMARVRAGEISVMEALEDGRVEGDIGPLAVLAGIVESPEFHAAELATGRHALALATLGELDADPRVGPVIAATTLPPDTAV